MLIALESYQASWADDYSMLAELLRPCFQDAALRIDHIGSTAVHGLTSKPIIDIQVTVDSLESVPSFVTRLQDVGFKFRADISSDRSPPWEDEILEEWKKSYFKMLEGNAPKAQVHVREAGRKNQRYALLFRDYLRAHVDVRDTYGRFKVQVAEAVGHASEAGGTGPYLDLKNPFFDMVIFAAERWAREEKWNGHV